MGWVILVIICIIILIVILNLSHRKKAPKTESRSVTRPIPDQPAEDGPLPPVYQTKKSSKDLHRSAKGQPRIYQPTTTLRPPAERHKSYARYDWQKLFEDSIVSLFSEELSPASSYIYEANRLEIAGADHILVEQALAKARKLDAKTTELYLARWSIVKKRQNERE